MITAKTPTSKSKAAVALPPVRIMIIDDDEDEFMILSNYIKNIQGRAFVVDCSSDHEAALEDMRQNRHDLYFIDYKLGAKTGLDILQEAVSTT
jgi:two-component SAPR family response regulator